MFAAVGVCASEPIWTASTWAASDVLLDEVASGDVASGDLEGASGFTSPPSSVPRQPPPLRPRRTADATGPVVLSSGASDHDSWTDAGGSSPTETPEWLRRAEAAHGVPKGSPLARVLDHTQYAVGGMAPDEMPFDLEHADDYEHEVPSGQLRVWQVSISIGAWVLFLFACLLWI